MVLVILAVSPAVTLVVSLCLSLGCQTWHPNWVRLTPSGTNLGLFKIRFSTFWLAESKCTENDLKKFQICPTWSQSDPICMPNLTFMKVSRVLGAGR